jgi:hypothetical protein
LGDEKPPPIRPFLVKKFKYNKKVSFDMISNDTFLLYLNFFIIKGLQGDGFLSLAYHLSELPGHHVYTTHGMFKSRDMLHIYFFECPLFDVRVKIIIGCYMYFHLLFCSIVIFIVMSVN